VLAGSRARWGERWLLRLNVVVVLALALGLLIHPNRTSGQVSCSSGSQPSCPPTDLVITKADSPDPVLAGQSLTYRLTATNSGPIDDTRVTVADPLPANATFVSASSTRGTCTESAGTVTCRVRSLPVNTTATVTIVVTPTTAGALTNTASISGDQPDSDSSNNSATATTTINPAADLSLTKTDAPDPVSAGSIFTYALTATNGGPSPATGVVVTDTLPTHVEFSSVSARQGTCTRSNGTITCRLRTLSAGASATVSIKVRATGNLPSVVNTASVAGTEADPVSSNNRASATTTVVRRR
jgi:uncharacterized repeat protein (TIGR01451 family)